ncbi:DivIVA domain-containing protein [Agrococcus jejuensis]|uniref:Cell wall synthesis protein Wag31 n=1 Tax=Agrococcus jejuensis TaxID=399736 RepID=A0A1G8A9A5_9MICO|nr:DivIVA domain-containing protein [Agrococcus jejuensis]SDH17508.1 DivIVA domain-containing protein [Agrococcus jejuensis]
MALTPNDIVERTFETTRFRDGYDQDEVDNFLDEIVTEFRAIIAEKERLEARVAELESGAPAAPVAAPVASAPAPEPTPAPVVEAPAPAPAAEADASATAVSPEGLLALAQRVHDEHVAEGQRRKDELVAEAEGQAKEIETAATKRRADLDKEFEKTKTTLEQEKSDLETKIDELKTFERDYRLRLRGYIESQLRDLDRTSFAFGGSSAPAQQ